MQKVKLRRVFCRIEIHCIFFCFQYPEQQASRSHYQQRSSQESGYPSTNMSGRRLESMPRSDQYSRNPQTRSHRSDLVTELWHFYWEPFFPLTFPQHFSLSLKNNESPSPPIPHFCFLNGYMKYMHVWVHHYQDQMSENNSCQTQRISTFPLQHFYNEISHW